MSRSDFKALRLLPQLENVIRSSRHELVQNFVGTEEVEEKEEDDETAIKRQTSTRGD
jgi:hypothetical protein